MMIQPLSYHKQVWLYLIISILVGVESLYGLFWCLSRMNNRQLKSKNENRFEKALAVIFGNILLQGINVN